MNGVNYTISFKTRGKNIVKWSTGETLLLNHVEPHLILPHKEKGFHLLGEEGITHYIENNTKKLVLMEPKNWFGTEEPHNLLYFIETNVLFVSFFDGDHDYIWWWSLSKYDQPANLDKPAYFNGVFNNELTLERFDDRFAISEDYSNDLIGGCTCCRTDDDDDDYSFDIDTKDDCHFTTLIWDTKTMQMHAYNGRLLKKKLEIERKQDNEYVVTIYDGGVKTALQSIKV